MCCTLISLMSIWEALASAVVLWFVQTGWNIASPLCTIVQIVIALTELVQRDLFYWCFPCCVRSIHHWVCHCVCIPYLSIYRIRTRAHMVSLIWFYMRSVIQSMETEHYRNLLKWTRSCHDTQYFHSVTWWTSRGIPLSLCNCCSSTTYKSNTCVIKRVCLIFGYVYNIGNNNIKYYCQSFPCIEIKWLTNRQTSNYILSVRRTNNSLINESY